MKRRPKWFVLTSMKDVGPFSTRAEARIEAKKLDRPLRAVWREPPLKKAATS